MCLGFFLVSYYQLYQTAVTPATKNVDSLKSESESERDRRKLLLDSLVEDVETYIRTNNNIK